MFVAGARVWQGLALLCCALFLSAVAQFYRPQLGFTAFLGLAEDGHSWEIPALQAVPHHHNPPFMAYDGGQYVQLALEPLLRDQALDRALDNPAYRTRRILFSWTAWLAGLGRPAWIVQAYALQNVVCWVLLAWVMTRWLPPATPRGFAAWFAVMFSHGLLSSVRLSLLDGPSMLLLALALAASERGRTWTSAAVIGIAGLGRETNLLGTVGLPWPDGWRGWVRLAGAAVVAVLPLLVWQDYIWSIYRGASASAGTDHITPPLLAYARKWHVAVQAVQRDGLYSYASSTVLVMIALSVQAAYLAWHRAWQEPWWRLSAVFAVLMLTVDYVVWEGQPGAITRVVLPLSVGFNVLLYTGRGPFWPWFVAGNLFLAASAVVLPWTWWLG
jgi:hypothetical protein